MIAFVAMIPFFIGALVLALFVIPVVWILVKIND
jgi:hypothetical protein